MSLCIRGLCVVGGFGCGKKPFLEAASQAEAGNYASNPQCEPLLADLSPLTAYANAQATRRMDGFTRLCLLGAIKAIKDATEDVAGCRTGIIIATGYGPFKTSFDLLDSFIDYGAALISPMTFSRSVQNIPAASLSSYFGITGPCLTVSQFETSVASAMLTAKVWLGENRVDRVLFGAADVYAPILSYCADRFTNDDSSDFDGASIARHGHLLGEGAAFFLLSREEGAPSHYGRIRDVDMGRETLEPEGQKDTCRLVTGAPVSGSTPSTSVVERELAMKLGVFPVNTAFDIAYAALTLAGSPPAPIRRIQCLSRDYGGAWGMVTLEGEGASSA